MASLLSLPNELLVDVFAACPDIDPAIGLADTSQHLRAIWGMYAATFIEGILQRSIPAYTEAVTLAVAEHQHSATGKGTATASSTDLPSPKLEQLLPILKRNAELCAMAQSVQSAHID